MIRVQDSMVPVDPTSQPMIAHKNCTMVTKKMEGYLTFDLVGMYCLCHKKVKPNDLLKNFSLSLSERAATERKNMKARAGPKHFPP